MYALAAVFGPPSGTNNTAIEGSGTIATSPGNSGTVGAYGTGRANNVHSMYLPTLLPVASSYFLRIPVASSYFLRIKKKEVHLHFLHHAWKVHHSLLECKLPAIFWMQLTR